MAGNGSISPIGEPGRVEPRPSEITPTRPYTKFIGFALLFNALFWLFGLFVQIRGWIDVTASYVVLGLMWLIGASICLAVAHQSRISRKTIAVAISSGVWALALIGLNAIAPQPTQQNANKTKGAPHVVPADAKIAIVPPPNTSGTLLTWVPHLSVVPSIESHGKMAYPAFTIKNLSTDPISSLRIDWSIAGTPIRNILRESEMLQKYRATYTNGRFSMNGLNGTGIGGPVADRDTNTLPYLEEHGESEINIPGSIWSNLTLRLLDNQQRPPGVHGDLVDEMRSYHAGPIIATVTYMQGNTLRGRSFSIDVLVITTADYAYIGGDQSLPNHSVALAFRSPDNLRAYLRFVTLPAVFSSEEH
jgi:hypothetical protein